VSVRKRPAEPPTRRDLGFIQVQLDDLQDVVDLLRRDLDSKPRPRPDVPPPRVSISVGDFDCDTIGDLRNVPRTAWRHPLELRRVDDDLAVGSGMRVVLSRRDAYVSLPRWRDALSS
jgi:hypothetical protein